MWYWIIQSNNAGVYGVSVLLLEIGFKIVRNGRHLLPLALVFGVCDSIAVHILPNVAAPLTVVATNGVASAIITGAALSFLGLGQQPPDPEWGLMLNEGREFIRAAAWVTTYPGLAIMITVLSINLLGDGLRDILDPRLKL